MSADLSLTWPEQEVCIRAAHRLPEFSFPIRRPWTVEPHDFNVTYNLSPMLKEAGAPRWEHFDGMKAAEAAGIITNVIKELLSDPAKYAALNPPNGWGDYDGLVAFLIGMRDAMDDHPEATIRTHL